MTTRRDVPNLNLKARTHCSLRLTSSLLAGGGGGPGGPGPGLTRSRRGAGLGPRPSRLPRPGYWQGDSDEVTSRPGPIPVAGGPRAWPASVQPGPPGPPVPAQAAESRVSDSVVTVTRRAGAALIRIMMAAHRRCRGLRPGPRPRGWGTAATRTARPAHWQLPVPVGRGPPARRPRLLAAPGRRLRRSQ